MGFDISGPLSGSAVAVNLPAEAVAGFAALMSEQDAGTILGSRRTKALEASEDFRLRVGMDTPLLHEFFPGAALNSALFTAPVTTATVTVAGGFVTLNAGLSVASGAVARVSSYRSFPMLSTCEVSSRGLYCGCLSISVTLFPRSICFRVCSSRSLPNCTKA